MTDDDLVRRLLVGACAQNDVAWSLMRAAADRIKALTAEHNATLARLAGAVAREIALTAERDQAWKMVAEADNRLGQALGDALQDKADNARLLDHAVDLFRQVRIATYSGMAVRREIPAVQIQILADIDAAEFCAALNTGKEPSHE